MGAARLMHDDCGGAPAQLLEIARRDPLFRRGAGRNRLLALFNLLGEQDTHTQRYRGDLFTIASRRIFSAIGSGSADGVPLDYIYVEIKIRVPAASGKR